MTPKIPGLHQDQMYHLLLWDPARYKNISFMVFSHVPYILEILFPFKICARSSVIYRFANRTIFTYIANHTLYRKIMSWKLYNSKRDIAASKGKKYLFASVCMWFCKIFWNFPWERYKLVSNVWHSCILFHRLIQTTESSFLSAFPLINSQECFSIIDCKSKQSIENPMFKI